MDLRLLIDWFKAHPEVIAAATAVSVLVFVASLVLVPVLAARIPADYFVRPRRQPWGWGRRHPVLRWLVLIAKNLLGVVLVVTGLGMLVLPGPGMVALLIGVMLTSFPGKFRFERWLISRRPVRRGVNWMRRRGGRPDLVLEAPEPGPS